MLEGGPLLEDEFAALDKECVLFCHITTRIEGRENDDMLSKMGGTGFPTLMVLDADGNKLANGDAWTNWPPPAADFVTLVNKGKEVRKRLADLAAAVGKGEKARDAELLALQIELRHIGLEAARKRMAGLEVVDAETKTSLEAGLVSLEVDEILASEKLESAEDAARIGKRLAQMPTAPSGDKAEMFWSLIMQYAESVNDAATFERGIAGMKAIYGEHPNFAKWVEKMNAKVEEIRAAAGQDGKPGKDAKPGKDGKPGKPGTGDKK